MPESEQEFLDEALLPDLLGSTEVSLISLSPKSSGSFEGRFWRGRGTGPDMAELDFSSVAVSGTVPFLGKGSGPVDGAEVGFGVSEECSTSKLVWLVSHSSFPGDYRDGEEGEEEYCYKNIQQNCMFLGLKPLSV